MNNDATPTWRDHLGLAVLLFVISLGVAQVLYFRAELPARVASHFDGAGRPNGWMSRDGFVLIQCVLLLALGALFGFGGRLLKVTPNGWINLPNRNYWLAPERRAESVAVLAGWMRWLGAGTLAFLMVVFQFTVQANLRRGRLDSMQFLMVTGLLLGGMAIAVGWLYRRFRALAPDRG
jgi:hypothetical protein